MHPLARKHTCAEARVSTQHAEQHTRQGGAPSGLSSPLMYGGRLLQRCTAGTAECTIARPSSASHSALICAATSSPALWLFLLRRTLRSRCIAYTANLQARCASSLYSIRPNLGRERDAHTRIFFLGLCVPTMPSASLLRGCLLGLSSSGTQCDLCCLACRTVPLRRRFGRPRDCDDA